MNADEIVFARPQASGVFFAADMTATVPTSATATLTGFTELGYVSDAGIVQTIDRSVVELKDMGGDTVKILDESHAVTYKLTPLQLNEAFFVEMLGAANVTAAGGVVSAAVLNGAPLPNREYVFDMLLSDQRAMRIVVPCGHLTATGDMTFKAGTVTNAEFTIAALPDASGNKAYYYFA